MDLILQPANDTGAPQSSDAYGLYFNDVIRTLSTNTADNTQSIEGLLYVPDLPSSDPCTDLSAQNIPQNVTRQASFPTRQYPFIALAPWMTPECTKSYLSAAHGSLAFIFYLTDNRTGTPPPVNDPTWKLNDGGSWKSENTFPVYVIPSSIGTRIMHDLGVYSEKPGNGSHSGLLTAQHDSSEYIRLYTSITMTNTSALPSLWAFLLIVLGVVLLLVGITSVSMHCIQRRNRLALQRRVVAGEVDLEALGIKRLTVPPEALKKLPMFIYVFDEKQQLGAQLNCARKILNQPTPGVSPDFSPLSGDTSKRRSVSEPLRTDAPLSTSALGTVNPTRSPPSFAYRQLTYSQPTCPICLDDFESYHTTVRELPCKHIFHPKCIDKCLLENSSLCPVCKGKVLPKGYCPNGITNAMVRRERQARRRQQRETPEAPERNQSSGNSGNANTLERPMAVGRRMASFHRQFGRSAMRSNEGSRSSSAPAIPTAIEMNDRAPAHSAVAELPGRRNFDRNERARRRVSVLLGQQPTADDEDRERWARMPKCEFMPHFF